MDNLCFVCKTVGNKIFIAHVLYCTCILWQILGSNICAGIVFHQLTNLCVKSVSQRSSSNNKLNSICHSQFIGPVDQILLYPEITLCTTTISNIFCFIRKFTKYELFGPKGWFPCCIQCDNLISMDRVGQRNPPFHAMERYCKCVAID